MYVYITVLMLQIVIYFALLDQCHAPGYMYTVTNVAH